MGVDVTDFRRIFPRKSGSRLETTGSTCEKRAGKADDKAESHADGQLRIRRFKCSDKIYSGVKASKCSH